MIQQKLTKILVVEDNPSLQKQLKWTLTGYHVELAHDRESAINQIKTHQPSVVTLDLGLPPDTSNASEGLATLESILTLAPKTKVIVVTGNDDHDNALKAIELGAYDFYQKPIDPKVLLLIVDRATFLTQLEYENHQLIESNTKSLDGIVGTSPQILSVCRMLEKIGPTQATSLILGESGTGKELIARALHKLSPRRENPFIAINCAAIPENLLESELFGYEKGAFTGAIKKTPGKIEIADGGSLFLDEIGDMPMMLQSKLLRFLQERVIERIGGRSPIPVDVRVICATHKDLQLAISDGLFREDLFYRLSEIVIDVPPLRNRDGDRLLLAQTFLDQFSKKNGRRIRGFTNDARSQIEAYSWPGNVRELENKINRAVILAEGQQITATDLGFNEEIPHQSLNLIEARERVERQLIERAMAIHNHNISHTANALGISRPSLYKLFKKLNIATPVNESKTNDD